MTAFTAEPSRLRFTRNKIASWKLLSAKLFHLFLMSFLLPYQMPFLYYFTAHKSFDLQSDMIWTPGHAGSIFIHRIIATNHLAYYITLPWFYRQIYLYLPRRVTNNTQTGRINVGTFIRSALRCTSSRENFPPCNGIPICGKAHSQVPQDPRVLKQNATILPEGGR